MSHGAAPRVIGVLGGMGPAATVQFMARVLALTPAEDDRDHVPMLVDNNTQAPSRIAALIEGTGADPAPVLAAMAERLEAMGAAALAMPCNTAHHYAAEIERAATIPFLDVRALSAEAARRAGVSRLGVLASPAVAKVGVFEPALTAAGVTPLYGPTAPLLAAVRALKRNPGDAGALATLRATVAGMRADGADAILIACSEFSLATENLRAEATEPGAILDTVDLLAEAAIKVSIGADALSR